jgi:hypothetical protein
MFSPTILGAPGAVPAVARRQERDANSSPLLGADVKKSGAALCCAVLKFTVPKFTVLKFTVLKFTVPKFTVPRFTVIKFTVPKFTVPKFTVLKFTVLKTRATGNLCRMFRSFYVVLPNRQHLKQNVRWDQKS